MLAGTSTIQSICLLVLCASAVEALLFSLPSTTTITTPGAFTFTFTSEASDPAGNISFWLGHSIGKDGLFELKSGVPPAQNATQIEVTIPSITGDGQQWAVFASPDLGQPSLSDDDIIAQSSPFSISAVASASNSLSQSATPSAAASGPVFASGSTSAAATSPSSPSQPSSTSQPSLSSTTITPSYTQSISASSTTGINANVNTDSASNPHNGAAALSSSPKVPIGPIVGAAFGATILLLFFLLVLCLYMRKRRRSRALDLEIERALAAHVMMQSYPFSTTGVGAVEGGPLVTRVAQPYTTGPGLPSQSGARTSSPWNTQPREG